MLVCTARVPRTGLLARETLAESPCVKVAALPAPGRLGKGSLGGGAIGGPMTEERAAERREFDPETIPTAWSSAEEGR